MPAFIKAPDRGLRRCPSGGRFWAATLGSDMDEEVERLVGLGPRWWSGSTTSP
jgi:hypothetical protein